MWLKAPEGLSKRAARGQLSLASCSFATALAPSKAGALEAGPASECLELGMGGMPGKLGKQNCWKWQRGEMKCAFLAANPPLCFCWLAEAFTAAAAASLSTGVFHCPLQVALSRGNEAKAQGT